MLLETSKSYPMSNLFHLIFPALEGRVPLSVDLTIMLRRRICFPLGCRFTIALYRALLY